MNNAHTIKTKEFQIAELKLEMQMLLQEMRQPKRDRMMTNAQYKTLLNRISKKLSSLEASK